MSVIEVSPIVSPKIEGAVLNLGDRHDASRAGIELAIPFS
jgi:hypothetical protein